MLTGEVNYRDAGADLQVDLLRQPELAANVDTACRIALWYWRERVPQAQREDVSAATVAVNGGKNGLEDRYARFDAWQSLLTPQFLAELDAGRIRPGAAVGPAGAREIASDGELRRLEQADEVRTLQRDLRQLDLSQGRRNPVRETGTFDDWTEEAVRRFQRGHAMTVTGRVDETLGRAIHDAAEAVRGREDAARRHTGVGAPDAATRLSQADARMLEDVTTHVHALDRARGRTLDDASERLAWALYAEAKATGLTRVDHVVLSHEVAGIRAGQNVFAVQGGLQDERNRVATLDTTRALAQPIEVSIAQAAAAPERAAVLPPTQAMSIGAATAHRMG